MPAELLVVGAINVDLVVATDRLPGPGETVVGAGLQRHGGGKGANAAVAAARSGATVRLVGAVGTDEGRYSTLDELRAEGVSDRHVAILDDATGVALIVVDAAGENQIAVGAGANGALTAEHVQQSLHDALPEARCVLVSTEISSVAVRAAVESAARSGVRCVLNPAPPIPAVVDLLPLGPVLTPNATELIELASMLGPSADGPVGGDGQVRGLDAGPDLRRLTGCARQLMDRTGAPVVVTMGGDGALVLTTDGSVEHVPAPHVAVRDTTGAGDAFNGVLAARLAAGDELGVAVRTAVVAASLSVQGVGARSGMPDGAAIVAAAGDLTDWPAAE